jgi:hypothetical protein
MRKHLRRERRVYCTENIVEPGLAVLLDRITGRQRFYDINDNT